MPSFDFAYRIEKGARMAYDTETKEPAEAYLKVKLTFGPGDVTKADVEQYHKDVSKSLGLDPKFLTPISLAEYIEETGENVDEMGES